LRKLHQVSPIHDPAVRDFDNNGSGAPRTFAPDLSALGTFNSAALVTLDASTPAAGTVV
jgi:hypothetical protein